MNRTYKTPQEELGLTDEQIRAQMLAEGLDPQEEADALRSMAKGMRRNLVSTAPHQERLTELAHKRFALFEEAVAAGVATPSTHEGLKEASLTQILAQADPFTCIWVPVKGTSMKDAGIHDGDVVLVNTKQTPKSGDIVVAHVAPHGQVVKRLELCTDGSAILHSENSEYSPIHIKEADLVQVRGVVIARAGGV